MWACMLLQVASTERWLTVVCHEQLLFEKYMESKWSTKISGTKCSRHVCFCPCEVSTAAVCVPRSLDHVYCLIWCDKKSAHNLQHGKVDKIFSFKEENYPQQETSLYHCSQIKSITYVIIYNDSRVYCKGSMRQIKRNLFWKYIWLVHFITPLMISW